MNLLYTKQLATMLTALAITSGIYAQNKTKTITIINGDTTISESNLNEKDLKDLDKQINVVINDDGKKSKTIVKKIIIDDGDSKPARPAGGDGEAMAYAYAIGDGDDQDVDVSTDEKGNATKVIIKNKREVNENVSEKKEKENLNLNINVTKSSAKVDVKTSSKEPLNISVLDENGKQVFYDSKKDGGDYSKEIPLSKKGTYFLNIIQNKKSTSEKIVIE